MDTLPAQLLAYAAAEGGRVAIREKAYGIWQSYTWAQSLDRVRALALGFARLGFGRGDRLAIIGDNRPELYWSLLAAQALGGIPVPVYQDAPAGELRYAIAHAGARIVVAEDQEQVDKILEVRAQLPAVEHVLYEDPKGLRHYAEPGLARLDAVEAAGREPNGGAPAAFRALVAGVGPEDIALISYTSGTTGASKGVMLSHRALLATGRSFLQVVPVGPGDQMLAYLPMAWVGDTFFSVVVALLSGAAINCPESAETVRADFREIGPTVVFAPPRIWENLLAQCQVKIEDADWLKRTVTRHLVAAAMRSAREVLQDGVPATADRVRCAIGEPLVFAALRDQLGLRRIRVAITGGAPIAPEVLEFFRGIGVNLTQLYGMTECSTPATVQRAGQVKPDTVGPPIPGVQLRIDERGEVLIASPGLFSGYFRDPAATAEVLSDGWLRTGDAGLLDPDGHLVILDRAKDVSHLEDGTVFAPQYIENKLKFSPYIKEAVAVGHARPYVAAMLNIDPDVVGNWAQRRQVPYSGYTDLAQNPRIGDLIAGEVRRVNALLAPALRVRRFVVLHKELDPDDAEITRTRKVRRHFIAEKYAPIIAALYDPAASDVEVRATVRYEDGREAQVSRALRIRAVESGGAPAAPAATAAAAAVADA
ncbi:MAG TPA: AMP-binding protein [bacterium]|nr:AMP-binding protein [bacterium]